ncbi:hypothetical protein PG984_013129 [Apiospora sp. TS-2023a]
MTTLRDFENRAAPGLALASREQLQQSLGMANVDSDDVEFMMRTKDKIPARYRLESRHMLDQRLFDKWFYSTSSSKLLVQWGSPLPEPADASSSLSFLCANLMREKPTMSSYEHLLTIRWFCGRHLEPTVNNGNELDGTRAMLMSLIVQLLRGYVGPFHMEHMSSYINLHAILTSSPDTNELLRLFVWLVMNLPSNRTLVCIVDGVDLYEKRDPSATANMALLALLTLTTDLRVTAKVKVLFTSAPGPFMLGSLFGTNETVLLDPDMLSNPK